MFSSLLSQVYIQRLVWKLNLLSQNVHLKQCSVRFKACICPIDSEMAIIFLRISNRLSLSYRVAVCCHCGIDTIALLSVVGRWTGIFEQRCGSQCQISWCLLWGKSYARWEMCEMQGTLFTLWLYIRLLPLSVLYVVVCIKDTVVHLPQFTNVHGQCQFNMC